MLINEILRIKGNVLYTTPPNAAVLSAVKVMAQHDIGSLVVMDRGQKAGIVTFAEVLRAFRGWPMYKILGCRWRVWGPRVGERKARWRCVHEVSHGWLSARRPGLQPDRADSLRFLASRASTRNVPPL